MALLSRLPPEGRKRSGNKADKEPDGSGVRQSIGGADPLARPRKPTAQPIPRGRKICQYFRIPRPGWDRASIMGRYTSNTTASTPPETPGRIAPAPISAPHSRSRSQRSRSACLYGSVIFHLLTQTVYRVSYQHSPLRAIRNCERFENFGDFGRFGP